jgi:L,D-peptidoglycan transpeptidase YkuD (ErfK/YbiS/YcfS/YnhG family)
MGHRLLVHTTTSQLFWPGGTTTCASGKNGVCLEADKREGDGKTPLGCYGLRSVFVRQDRLGSSLVTVLPLTPLEPDFGWCDASGDPLYNQFIRHPYPASAEHLWRDDGLYDIIVVLGHNDAPVVPGLGSAIFLHCCTYRTDGTLKPTQGCIAVPRDALVAMLTEASPASVIDICQTIPRTD